jgi:hypothetical protein
MSSNSLNDIINRRRKGCDRPQERTKISSSNNDNEEESTGISTWVIVAAIIIVLILLFVIYWWFWKKPAQSVKASILDEMRNQTPTVQNRTANMPGTMSLKEFRELESRFSTTDSNF